MPIQDDINDANLSRLEREAQRQKRAAQQAPAMQYMGTDGTTGQVRVISGSGASSVGVANHSNTQARPGDIKRGFAGGFDRGNVRRSEAIRPRRTKTGEVMVLFSIVNSTTNKKDLYLGGHVADPIKLPVSFDINDEFDASIETVGENNYIVGYQNVSKKIVGVIKEDGITWEAPVPAWSGSLTHKGSGFFDNVQFPQALYFQSSINLIQNPFVDSDDQYSFPPQYRTRTVEQINNVVDTTTTPDPYGINNPQGSEHRLTTDIYSGNGVPVGSQTPGDVAIRDFNTSSIVELDYSSKSNYICSSKTGLNIINGTYSKLGNSLGSRYVYETYTNNFYLSPATSLSGGSSQASQITKREATVFLSFDVQGSYLIQETTENQTVYDTVYTERSSNSVTRTPGSESNTYNYFHEIYNAFAVFDSGNSYFYRIEKGTKTSTNPNLVTNYDVFMKCKAGTIQVIISTLFFANAYFYSIKYQNEIDSSQKPIVASFEYFGGTLGQNNPAGQDPLIVKVTRRILDSSFRWTDHSVIEKPVFAIPNDAKVYDLDYFSS